MANCTWLHLVSMKILIFEHCEWGLRLSENTELHRLTKTRGRAKPRSSSSHAQGLSTKYPMQPSSWFLSFFFFFLIKMHSCKKVFFFYPLSLFLHTYMEQIVLCKMFSMITNIQNCINIKTQSKNHP